MNSKIFDQSWIEYDKWYEDNESVYKAELNAVKALIPSGKGLEIGVGTGRFSQPFHVEFGIDPSLNMLRLSKKRNIQVVQAKGEELPFKKETFHFILIMVTLCFVEDVFKVLSESMRTLKKNGKVITGLINKNSRLGKDYEKSRQRSQFYKHAHFFSPEIILKLFKETGFKFIGSRQTLFRFPGKINDGETLKKGYNKGGFVVLKAEKV